jgi:hypothetical protein
MDISRNTKLGALGLLAITVVGAGTGFAVTKLHSGSASAATQPSVLRTGVTRDRGGFGFAAPPGGFGRRGPGFDGGGGLPAAATYLGLSTTDLAAKLRAGQTLAQIADSTSGKSVSGLVAAMTAAQKSRLDAAVKTGRLTQAQADSLGANLTDRITALVNGQGFGFRHGFDRPGGQQRPGGATL